MDTRVLRKASKHGTTNCRGKWEDQSIVKDVSSIFVNKRKLLSHHLFYLGETFFHHDHHHFENALSNTPSNDEFNCNLCLNFTTGQCGPSKGHLLGKLVTKPSHFYNQKGWFKICLPSKVTVTHVPHPFSYTGDFTQRSEPFLYRCHTVICSVVISAWPIMLMSIFTIRTSHHCVPSFIPFSCSMHKVMVQIDNLIAVFQYLFIWLWGSMWNSAITDKSRCWTLGCYQSWTDFITIFKDLSIFVNLFSIFIYRLYIFSFFSFNNDLIIN